MPVTKNQAEMLASLGAAARPTGARRWDAPGVMAAIGKVRHLELAEVLMAVGRAARDRDLETPAAIGNPGAPCWIERPVERWEPDKTTPEHRCGICGNPRGRCETAPRFAGDDHAFEPDFKEKRGDEVTQIVQAVKAEIAPTAEPPAPTTPPEQRDPRADAARAALTTTEESADV